MRAQYFTTQMMHQHQSRSRFDIIITSDKVPEVNRSSRKVNNLWMLMMSFRTRVVVAVVVVEVVNDANAKLEALLQQDLELEGKF
jgi:hypothetical protein